MSFQQSCTYSLARMFAQIFLKQCMTNLLFSHASSLQGVRSPIRLLSQDVVEHAVFNKQRWKSRRQRLCAKKNANSPSRHLLAISKAMIEKRLTVLNSRYQSSHLMIFIFGYTSTMSDKHVNARLAKVSGRYISQHTSCLLHITTPQLTFVFVLEKVTPWLSPTDWGLRPYLVSITMSSTSL